MILDVFTSDETPTGQYRGIKMTDARCFSSGDPVADFSFVLQALVSDGMTVAMPSEDLGLPGERTPSSASDALTDRVNAWLSIAMTKAVVKPIEGTDTFVATLPPFRKFSAAECTESLALTMLRSQLGVWAKNELNAGRDLPTWESKIPEISPEAKRLVRLTKLKHELKTRAAQWGGERQLLPAGAVERCLADIDALVTRHAMQINGVTPPENKPALTLETKTSDAPGGTSEAP